MATSMPPKDVDRNYRRGAIMGLTVAESLMLIAFALLMLLALWRVEADKDLSAVQSELTRMRKQLTEARLLNDLPEDERSRILRLIEGDHLELLRLLDDAGLDRSSRSEMREIVRRLNLLEDNELRRLVEAVSVWPAEERVRLLELVALTPDEQSISDLVALLQDGVTPETIRKALAQMAANVDETKADSLRASIRERLQVRLERQRELATATKAALGDHVRKLGGDIDENGVITLPDGILFEVGRDEPRPAFRSFLAIACPSWFESMRTLSFDVDEIRIEGHASTEWASGSSFETAYFNNLDLSQRRAGRVLQDCLSSAGTTQTGLWARQRATAIGFSSSRAILNADGKEDRVRSRRVVFKANTVSDDIFSDLDEVVAN